VTRKRILVEFDVVDTLPGATLEVLNRLAETLDELKKADVIVEYGIQIEDPRTWIVTLKAQQERDKTGYCPLRLGRPSQLKAQQERDKTMRKYYKPIGEGEGEEKERPRDLEGYP